MKFTGIHVNSTRELCSKRLPSLLIGIILLLSFLLFFANAMAAPPPDGPGEVKLSAQDNGRQVELKEGQVLVIGLESNPSTGTMWEAEGTDKSLLRQVGDTEFKPESPLSGAQGTSSLIGAPEQQILRFEAVAAGSTTLRLVYHRPWEKEVKPAKIFSLQVQGVGSFAHVKSPIPTASSSVEGPVLAADRPVLGLPVSYNWCTLGGCTPVKDQGSCGSCWAFSTVGVLESSIRIKDGATKDLSEQYLVSCNTDGWSCQGGDWAHDYHWNKIPPGETAAGAVYEADFPYQAADVPCSPPHSHHEKIVSWTYVGSDYGVPSTAAIKQAINDHGPVSAAVCAGSAFGHYSGGIFQTNETAACNGGVNHAIVLVGWDDNQGTWRLRNSWGSSWGDNGYMDIKYGTSNVGYAANYIVYTSGSCGDGYEPDDASTNAKWIAVNGATQTHNFHTAGDEDWAKFTVTAGSAYTITTSNLGANNDTILELYDTDGTTKLRDDGCAGPASCINNWTAPGDGSYFIKVRNAAGAGGCTGYDYNLAVASDSSAKIMQVFLPIIIKSSICRDTQVVQNGDFESGNIYWVQSPSNIIGLYYPHSGSRDAWFGGYDNADDRLYQAINIPAGVTSARLVLYLYVYSEESGDYPYDYFHAELQTASGGTLESFLWADNRMDSSNWWKGTWEWSDLSSHASQTRRLFFQGTTDVSLNTNFFVDDITLWSYCGGLPAGGDKNGSPGGWTWEKAGPPPGYAPDSATGRKGQ